MVAALFHAQFRQKYYRVFGFAIRCGIFLVSPRNMRLIHLNRFARLLGMRDSHDRSQKDFDLGLRDIKVRFCSMTANVPAEDEVEKVEGGIVDCDTFFL